MIEIKVGSTDYYEYEDFDDEELNYVTKSFSSFLEYGKSEFSSFEEAKKWINEDIKKTLKDCARKDRNHEETLFDYVDYYQYKIYEDGKYRGYIWVNGHGKSGFMYGDSQ